MVCCEILGVNPNLEGGGDFKKPFRRHLITSQFSFGLHLPVFNTPSYASSL